MKEVVDAAVEDLKPVLQQWAALQEAQTTDMTEEEKRRRERDGEEFGEARTSPLAQLLQHIERKKTTPVSRGAVGAAPMDYWRAHEQEKPELAFFACFIMMRLATSVECERSFSSLRGLMGIYRNRLTAENKKNELMIRMHPAVAYRLAKAGVPRVRHYALNEDCIWKRSADPKAEDEALRWEDEEEPEKVEEVEVVEVSEPRVFDSPPMLEIPRICEGDLLF
jgi:hypothetical protein